MLPGDGLYDLDATLTLWSDSRDDGVEHIYCEVCGMFTPHWIVTSDGAAAKTCRTCVDHHLRQVLTSLNRPTCLRLAGGSGSA